MSGFTASPSVILQDVTADIQAALDNLPSGRGTVYLGPGTWTLTAPLTMSEGQNIIGAGPGSTFIVYTADASLDIITITGGNCSLRDLGIYGCAVASSAVGVGTAGAGCGIKIAQLNAANGGPSWNFQPGVLIRNVQVFNTPSWCICATGTNAEAVGQAATVYAQLVTPVFEDCVLAFPNSNGAMFIGAGTTTLRINRLTTNSYNYGTYLADLINAGQPTTVRGAVHLYGIAQGAIDNCIFQSPAGTANVDAVMLSLNHCLSIAVRAPYFEVLDTGATRTRPFITMGATSDVTFSDGYFYSSIDGPMLILETSSASNTGCGVRLRDCTAFSGRATYTTSGGADPPPAGVEEGFFKTVDMDDLLFLGGGGAWPALGEGSRHQPVIVDNCKVVALNTGLARPWTTPKSPTAGYGIVIKQAAKIENPRLGVFPRLANVAELTTDVAQFFDTEGQGTYAYVKPTGDANDIYSGLWILDRDNGWRQMPFVFYSTLAPAGTVREGDFWYDQTAHKLKVYDGSTWQACW